MATTGFILPSANNDDDGTYSGFSNPANAQTDNTSFTNPSGANVAAWFWKTFDFSTAGLSSGDTVTGFNIRIRGKDTYNDGGWYIEVGHKSDADTVVDNYTLQRWPATSGDWPGAGSSTATTHTLALTDVPTDTEALSANFRLAIKITDSASFVNDAALEAIWLEVIYTAAGGGGRIMSSLAGSGGLAGHGGIAGDGGGLAG